MKKIKKNYRISLEFLFHEDIHPDRSRRVGISVLVPMLTTLPKLDAAGKRQYASLLILALNRLLHQS